MVKKKKIPSIVEIEHDLEEYEAIVKEAGRKVVDLEGFMEGEEEFERDRLREEGLSEKNIDNIKFKHFIITPDGNRIEIVWKSTDPWRGYYDLDIKECSKLSKKDAGNITACNVFMGNTAEALWRMEAGREREELETEWEEAYNKLQDLVNKLGAKNGVVALPTSNVFAKNIFGIISRKDKPFNRREIDEIVRKTREIEELV